MRDNNSSSHIFLWRQNNWIPVKYLLPLITVVDLCHPCEYQFKIGAETYIFWSWPSPCWSIRIMYQVLYQPLYSFGNKFRPTNGTPTEVSTFVYLNLNVSLMILIRGFINWFLSWIIIVRTVIGFNFLRFYALILFVSHSSHQSRMSGKNAAIRPSFPGHPSYNFLRSMIWLKQWSYLGCQNSNFSPLALACLASVA